MDEQYQTTRRQVVHGTGAITAGSMLWFNWGGFFGSDDPDEEIEVNVFTGQGLYDDYLDTYYATDSPYEPAYITAAYIEDALDGLLSGMDVGHDVAVIEDPIPTREFADAEEDTYREPWERYIDSELPNSDVAKDTNLLLTIDKPNAIINGDAEIPCSSCDGGNSTAAVTYDVDQFDFYMEDEYELKDRILIDDSFNVVGTALHEVGHTLGLDHDDDDVYSWSNEMTIMGTPVDARDAEYQLTRFSYWINRDDIRVGEEDSGNFWFF